jgi:hypothetical protein
MTANEMKYNLLLFYDKMFEMAAPSYDDRQIGAILSKSQLRVFKRHYMPLANKYREGFESTEQRRRDLEQFIESASLDGGSIEMSTSQLGVHPNGTFYEMPTDFLYAVEESLITDTSNGEEITVLPVRHDYYRANIRNSYKKPYKNLAWRMDFSRETHAVGESSASKKRTEIVTDGSNIIDYRVRYLISPPNIECDEVTPANQVHCILDSTLHDEIIDEAVKIIRAAVTPETYQISDKEQKDNES